MVKRKGSVSEDHEVVQPKRAAVDTGELQPTLPLSSEQEVAEVSNEEVPAESITIEQQETEVANKDEKAEERNEGGDFEKHDENQSNDYELAQSGVPSTLSHENLAEISSVVNSMRSSASAGGSYSRNHHRGHHPRGHQGNNGGASQNPTFIHLRILVSTREAVAILGKKGSSIARIRDASNAKLNVSENVPGIQERVVNVRGPAEFVAKAAGLIARTLFEEPFDKPSSPDARPFNMRILMPHTMMGALIGKGGSKFREIEEVSAAKLRAHEQQLPLSTDRILVVQGVADAIHIAVYYIATTYLQHKEYLSNARQQQYDPAAAMKQSRGSHHGGGGGGGGGKWDGSGMSNMQSHSNPIAPSDSGYYGDAYGGGMMGAGPSHRVGPQPYYQSSAPSYTNPSNRYGDNRISPPAPPDAMIPSLQEAQAAARAAPPGQQNYSQEVYIPNEYVGSVIGKGGQKIKDIRHFSGSKVKVEDTLNERNQRLIHIVGTPESNQVAIYLISARIETDRKRNEQGQNAEHPAKNLNVI
ncbi:hypothetical protein TRVA0_030S00342 [Trichomonascus vanleenenianus]|uniref:uncharacterized protein n=1 Tax=Trichomonascus vanleenenianus TaxID=2268995 RepID=UPI003ECB6F95